MSPAKTSSAPSRGRIDKREAILSAAFTVFARQGYAQACVKEIAKEAGVAKPTVYNHLTDKANLFREAMTAAADRSLAESLAVIETLTVPRDDDLRALLEDVGFRLLKVHGDPRSCALRRLVYAEVSWAPDLLDAVQGRGSDRITEALADRMARLSLAGRLRQADPVQAAEQFLALLTGPVATRTRMGTRDATDEELREVTQAAVDTFLRAYTPVA
ncbi:TetR/AcrR family transcriptional regulator [Actinomadura adrarensis]|uniref:TetR/AcrR family transcriptional regulator n=1 Tax=Actinomadura adrarensis TaxID=1819600 RepID=A0ABW3CRX1_9ACTN